LPLHEILREGGQLAHLIRASLPLADIRRPRDTPIWKLEASLKCRSCRKGWYAPPVRMIKLTETRAPHFRAVHRLNGPECMLGTERLAGCFIQTRAYRPRDTPND
jgi:hypothetical protein